MLQLTVSFFLMPEISILANWCINKMHKNPKCMSFKFSHSCVHFKTIYGKYVTVNCQMQSTLKVLYGLKARVWKKKGGRICGECHWGWLTAALIEAICLSYKLKYLHFILEMQMPILRDFPKLPQQPPPAGVSGQTMPNKLAIQIRRRHTSRSKSRSSGGRSLRKARSFVGVTIYAFGPRNVECILQFSWPAWTFFYPFCCNRIQAPASPATKKPLRLLSMGPI